MSRSVEITKEVELTLDVNVYNVYVHENAVDFEVEVDKDGDLIIHVDHVPEIKSLEAEVEELNGTISELEEKIADLRDQMGEQV